VLLLLLLLPQSGSAQAGDHDRRPLIVKRASHRHLLMMTNSHAKCFLPL